MSDFTIEQLEALKEGATPGPWMLMDIGEEKGWDFEILGRDPDRPVVFPSICYVDHAPDDARLLAAAPALVDALIAEKRAHQETLHLVRELWSDVHHHGNVGRASILRHLTRILEATDG